MLARGGVPRSAQDGRAVAGRAPNGRARGTSQGATPGSSPSPGWGSSCRLGRAAQHRPLLSCPLLSSQTSWGARCSGVSREQQGAGVRLGKIAPYVNLTPASIPSVTSDICVVVGCTVCGTLEPSSPGVLQVPPRSATGGQRLRVPRERAWTPARAGGTGQPRATRLPRTQLRAVPGSVPTPVCGHSSQRGLGAPPATPCPQHPVQQEGSCAPRAPRCCCFISINSWPIL